MRERPILFNGAMVRAILAGHKTQTRRAVNPQPTLDTDAWERASRDPDRWVGIGSSAVTGGTRQTWGWASCPFGQPGDRLWVRETWAPHADYPDARRAVYRADPGSEHDAERWHPSIHMPRWACRLVLEITDVRIERLQAISEADAENEGADPITAKVPTHWDAFRYVWEDTGGDWAADPWVWVIGFRPLEA